MVEIRDLTQWGDDLGVRLPAALASDWRTDHGKN